MSDESKRRRKERKQRERERERRNGQLMSDKAKAAARGVTPSDSSIRVAVSDRVAARFPREKLDYFAQRVIAKARKNSESNNGGLFLIRTPVGEIALVYLRNDKFVHACYKDEVPTGVLAEFPEIDSTYQLTEDEWQRQTQELWEATGGDFNSMGYVPLSETKLDADATDT